MTLRVSVRHRTDGAHAVGAPWSAGPNGPSTTGAAMSKGQRGNKEAKKPKQVQPATPRALPIDGLPTRPDAVPPSKKKQR
jgi:hypothetical protein